MHGISKAFGSGASQKRAVKNLTVGMPRGQCFGLLGINGAGKTMITHVWHPHSDATQDERVVSSCQNRCAINHVERQNAWVGLRRAAFWKHDAEFPGAFVPANKHISFENRRGGALASVKEVLGKTTAGLIETWKPKRGVRQHQVPRRVQLE